jgi:hypothetical protein
MIGDTVLEKLQYFTSTPKKLAKKNQRSSQPVEIAD